MSETSVVTNHKDAQAFVKDNNLQPSLDFFRTATDDYAAARCCLLNGLFMGFVLADQAFEKYLKGTILLIEPEWNVRKHGHKLRVLLAEVEKRIPEMKDLHKYDETIDRLDKHYNARYSDNDNQLQSKTTEELVQIDELLFFTNDLIPLPREIKMCTTGFFSTICAHCFQGVSVLFLSAEEFWLTKNNKALSPILTKLHMECAEFLRR